MKMHVRMIDNSPFGKIMFALIFLGMFIFWGLTQLDDNQYESAERFKVNEKIVIDRTGTLTFTGDYGEIPYQTVHTQGVTRQEYQYPPFENTNRFQLVKIESSGELKPMVITPSSRWLTIEDNSYQEYFKVDIREKGTYILQDLGTTKLENPIFYHQVRIPTEWAFVYILGIALLISFWHFISVLLKRPKRYVSKVSDFS